MSKNTAYKIVFVIFFLISFAGCSRKNIDPQVPLTTEVVLTDTLTPIETEISEPIVPTETAIPVPAAAKVNGEIIPLADFEEEYLRFLDGQEGNQESIDETTGRAIVLEDMIVNTLLAQGARELGFTLSEQYYQDRLNIVIEAAGGEEAFLTWVAENHYSEESFYRFYALSLEASWMQEKIINSVPKEAEQVRARQIMLQSRSLAETIYNQLQAGADFATLAWAYDPISGGELGWFPRNTLVIPEVEEAIFILEADQYTPILETDYGYQIIQVMERGVRTLSREALLIYQSQALEDWVTSTKNQSDLEILQ